MKGKFDNAIQDALAEEQRRQKELADQKEKGPSGRPDPKSRGSGTKSGASPAAGRQRTKPIQDMAKVTTPDVEQDPIVFEEALKNAGNAESDASEEKPLDKPGTKDGDMTSTETEKDMADKDSTGKSATTQTNGSQGTGTSEKSSMDSTRTTEQQPGTAAIPLDVQQKLKKLAKLEKAYEGVLPLRIPW